MEPILIVSSILLWILVLLNLLLTLALARRLNERTSQSGDPFAAIPKLERGQPAPDFSAETLEGSPTSLADFTGRVVVFLFMSPTCTPCRAKMPGLNALQSKALRAGVEMVLVSDSSRAEAKKFYDDFRTSLPVLVASRADNPFMDDYKASGTPFYCAIAADGTVQATGLLDDEWEALTKTWEAAQVEYSTKEVVANIA